MLKDFRIHKPMQPRFIKTLTLRIQDYYLAPPTLHSEKHDKNHPTEPISKKTFRFLDKYPHTRQTKLLIICALEIELLSWVTSCLFEYKNINKYMTQNVA